ncbi:MAG: hypothetical protein ACTSRA_16540 [Promethearchaeota archaeon]
MNEKVKDENTQKQVDASGIETCKQKITSIINEFTNALMFFQYIFLILPYGFLSITGINVPYTEDGFVAGFLMLIFITGPCIGFIGLLFWQLFLKKGLFKPNAFTRNETRLVSIFGCIVSAFAMMFYFVCRDGWHSDLNTLLAFIFLSILSSILAYFGMLGFKFPRGKTLFGLGFGFALVFVGLLYLLMILNFEYLLIGAMVTCLVVAPLNVVNSNPSNASTSSDNEKSNTLKFAWFEKAIEKKNIRNSITSIILTFIFLGVSNFFGSIQYFKYPNLAFWLEALIFFISTAITLNISNRLFKKQPVDRLILSIFVIAIANAILSDAIPAYHNRVPEMIISGIILGCSFTLLLRFRERQATFKSIFDWPSTTTVSIFYWIFLASLFGLIFSFTLRWSSLGLDMNGTLPIKTVFQSIFFVVILIGLGSISSSAKILKKIESGDDGRIHQVPSRKGR